MPVDRHPLRSVLETVGPDSCPGQFNFHCHTLCSDGSLEPLALIHQASAKGLTQLAVTDHHSSASFQPMQDWLEKQRDLGETVPNL